jgi:hypothetical protein
MSQVVKNPKMTALLEQAIRAASQLSDADQDSLAVRMLAEIAKEDEFDRALQSTGHLLAKMAQEAIAEHRAGLTLPFPTDGQ